MAVPGEPPPKPPKPPQEQRAGDERSRRERARTPGVVLLLGGASAAAVTATGQSKPPRAHAARGAGGLARRGGARDLHTAASYLGISTVQLAGILSSDQSLAEIAAATPGRSAAGLIEALVTAKR